MTLVKTTYNRRSFLKVSSATGGGMLLGFSWLAGCSPAEIEEEILAKPESWFDINAFISIGDNGWVTIQSPNPEIGQNVKTSMPMIVAEELDVDWKNVMVEQAGLNTVNFQRQVAGGSNSIRRGWKSLRTAGATARKMLLQAAATQWEVPLGELTTAAGTIYHQASGQSIGYGEVASAASSLEVPEEVELKDPKDFKIIGIPTKNVDGKKIVTGTPLFGLDYSEDRMLIAMVEHAPAFGMKLKSVDDSAAKAMPGIVNVVTIDTGLLRETRPTTYAFTSLVAIVGKTTWEVMQAKKALKVTWEWDTAAENSEEHERQMTAMLEAGAKEAQRLDGDPASAFKNAAKVIERTYSAPFLPHNTMEPMNFFASVTAEKAHLVGPIQTPARLAQSVSEALNLPAEQVSIMMTRMGGGFGRRLYGHFGLEAALISKQLQAPIKLVYTREDDMSNGTYRPAYKVKYRAALNEENELTAFHVHGVGIHGGPVFANRFPAGTVDNYLAENEAVTSNVSTGAWRAPRSNFIAGAEQSFLDEVAEALGKDPIDFRLELFDRASSQPVGEKNDYDPARYAGVLKLVKEKSAWGKEMPGVFRGVAAYFCHNSYIAQVMDIEMQEGKPKLKKVWCAVDCGIVVNPEGARNIIEGGVVDGIGHGMFGNLTIKDGVPQQNNFNSYKLIRHSDVPTEIETFFVDNGVDPTGLGEPGLPPAIGALANALYQMNGKRLYHQPFAQEEVVLG